MNDIQSDKKQFKLKTIMLIITGLLIASCFLVILYATRAKVYNERSIELSKLNMKYVEIAAGVANGSYNLTEQARLFAGTGDVYHLNMYLKEAKVDRHRGKAIAELARTSAPVKAVSHIISSMNCSLELMNREYYSMKLTALAYNIPDDKLPAEVLTVSLDKEDAGLSAEEMKKKATAVLFDDEYINSKKIITDEISFFLDSVNEDSQNEYNVLTNRVKLYANILLVTIAVMTVLIIFMSTFQFVFVIRPIVSASRSIKKATTIKMPDFLSEMESLSTSYNRLLAENAQLVEKLRVIAETDALTGLGNRTAYENFRNALLKDGGAATIFVFDVNDLRETNNNLGHSKGDNLLKKAAECIVNVFGENCFRIGGDEFVAFICGEEAGKASGYIEKFRGETKSANLKIAAGYSYAEDIGKTVFRQMFSEADKMMYLDKARIKELSRYI